MFCANPHPETPNSAFTFDVAIWMAQDNDQFPNAFSLNKTITLNALGLRVASNWAKSSSVDGCFQSMAVSVNVLASGRVGKTGNVLVSDGHFGPRRH